jgi:hypothetical protein
MARIGLTAISLLFWFTRVMSAEAVSLTSDSALQIPATGLYEIDDLVIAANERVTIQSSATSIEISARNSITIEGALLTGEHSVSLRAPAIRFESNSKLADAVIDLEGGSMILRRGTLRLSIGERNSAPRSASLSIRAVSVFGTLDAYEIESAPRIEAGTLHWTDSAGFFSTANVALEEASIAAVPEPQSGAMLLAALGPLGLGRSSLLSEPDQRAR